MRWCSKYVCYDWFNQRISTDETINLTLNNYDDFRLIIFTPIKKGKAVLGLKEKYLMPKTFTKITGGVQVLKKGTLLVYSETDIYGFTKVAENLYSKTVEKDEKILI